MGVGTPGLLPLARQVVSPQHQESLEKPFWGLQQDTFPFRMTSLLPMVPFHPPAYTLAAVSTHIPCLPDPRWLD